MSQMFDDIMNSMDYDSEDYVWEDINGNFYTLQDIDDRYLLNILRFIRKGGGYIDFLDEDKIKKLYEEARKRKLKFNILLDELINAFYEKVNLWSQSPDSIFGYNNL